MTTQDKKIGSYFWLPSLHHTPYSNPPANPVDSTFWMYPKNDCFSPTPLLPLYSHMISCKTPLVVCLFPFVTFVIYFNTSVSQIIMCFSSTTTLMDLHLIRIKSKSLSHEYNFAPIHLSVLNSYHTPICSFPSGFLAGLQVGQADSHFWVFELTISSVWDTLSLTASNLFPHFIHDFAQKSSLNTHLTCYTVSFYLALYFFIVPFTVYSYLLIGFSVFPLRIWTSGKQSINSLVITLSPMLRPASSTKDAQRTVVEFINDTSDWNSISRLKTWNSCFLDVSIFWK